ncbi:hypothetical protein JX266_004624 [Neoarthrinium moseri]|nr:hypothetical protein JX266_004624 [Neoarthrinium moseri]
MFNPAVANYLTQFYALGNTPAVDLARELPHGVDADCLLLGCGDVRNILFTAYSRQGLPRNVFLFSLVTAEQNPTDHSTAWSIYYDLYLRDEIIEVVRAHLARLLNASKSLETWRGTSFNILQSFCDEGTLRLVRACWLSMSSATTDANSKNNFAENLQRTTRAQEMLFGKVDRSQILTGLRSAAPVATQAMSDTQLRGFNKHWWEHGSLTESEAHVPNPLFSGPLSPNTLLHYGTDPLLGFHLASAFIQLAPKSPLSPEDGGNRGAGKAVHAATSQFRGWLEAFQHSRETIKIRWMVADALTFCHVLQVPLDSRNLSSNMYRRQFDMTTCNLDSHEYGTLGNAPRLFDVVDTSNLADHFGPLNYLVAIKPLLKDAATSTVWLETLLKTENSRQAHFESLLCGPSTTISLLLGLSAIETWTNASTISCVDEFFIAAAMGNSSPQIHSRMAWKLNKHVAGDGKSTTKVRMDPDALVGVICGICSNMFAHATADGSQSNHPRSAYPPYHCGSLAALISLIRTNIDSNWPEVLRQVSETLSQSSYALFRQELWTQLHLYGLHEEPQRHGVNPAAGRLHSWNSIPDIVALTLVIPRACLDKLYASEYLKAVAPTLQLVVAPSKSPGHDQQSVFLDLHVGFGRISTQEVSDDGTSISVREDNAGWSGESPLVVSCYVPSSILQIDPVATSIRLAIQTTKAALLTYRVAGLGPNLSVYEASINDTSHVFITRHLPGLQGPSVITGSRSQEKRVGSHNSSETTWISSGIDERSHKVLNLTGHVDFVSDLGKKLLANKSPIELQQSSPYVINIVFGTNKLIAPVAFPLPVSTELSKTRIARKSAYVEVIAQIADPLNSDSLAGFMFPIVLSPDLMPTLLSGHHLNLDTLPILDVDRKYKSQNQFLNTLVGSQFSVREKPLRNLERSSLGISTNLRLNFKESIFTMFMLSSGLQGGQTGMFTLSYGDLGVTMLIFVRAIRIDGAAGSAVLDAAVLPLTMDIVRSKEMEEFLLLLRELQLCQINVDDKELSLWRRVIPALVERCRTWSHTERCEYRKPGATIPLTQETGKQFLCSCGNGQMPANFLSIPEWDVASKHAVRIAISPTFSVPFVEDVLDTSPLKMKGKMEDLMVEKCRSCGKTKAANGGKLMACARCKEVSYCSKDCQKADWKKHRMECSAD